MTAKQPRFFGVKLFVLPWNPPSPPLPARSSCAFPAQVSEITCEVCRSVSSRAEPFIDLGLPLFSAATNDETPLGALLDSVWQPESLHGRNQYLCQTCQQLVNAQRCSRVTSAPNILALNLLRFAYNKEVCLFKEKVLC
jgi:ubiquitin C-terminal hydrolase